MAFARAANWEEELLTGGLSARALLSGAAYAGPGSGSESPSPIERPPILFTAGIPDVKSLPIDGLVAATEAVLREEGAPALQYGGSQGFAGLRDWLAAHWGKIEGQSLTASNFTLTNGSAHALDNICETFLDPGDVVVVEAPSFPGSIRTIRSLGVQVESVPVDDDGLVVEALEELVEKLRLAGRRARLLYAIATFHNPTGATLTLERRQQLLDFCDAEDVLIVEDDAYGELGFEGDQPPSLFSLARGRGVIKIGTFSKIIATGLRVGWCQAAVPVIDALVATRFDMGISPLLTHSIARYAADGRLEAHIEGMRRIYKHKRDLMVSELRERCADAVTWNDPRGGVFLWLKLNEDIDPAALADEARTEGVAYVGGRAFFAGLTAAEAPKAGSTTLSFGAAIDHLRLAYSFTAEDQIQEGIRRLARALERAKRAKV
jgi:2-aminoadipate transaminase